MANVEITLTLPAELAEKAREAGLLESERFAEYIDTELKRDSARHELKEMIASLRTAAPALSEADIEAELELAKAERIAETEAKRKQN
jgi:hypothetical protein